MITLNISLTLDLPTIQFLLDCTVKLITIYTFIKPQKKLSTK